MAVANCYCHSDLLPEVFLAPQGSLAIARDLDLAWPPLKIVALKRQFISNSLSLSAGNSLINLVRRRLLN